MRRREFIAGLGSTVGLPLAARAQQPKVPVVGYLDGGSPDTIEAFRKGLSETGFVEGRNVVIDYRAANSDRAWLVELAADLVRRRVAVIVADASALAAADAVKAANASIPIVFLGGGDPVELGLVASLNRPGGNITGVASMNNQLAAKRIALLREMVPGAERFAVLTGRNPVSDAMVKQAQMAAAAIGWPLEVLIATTNREIDAAFASLVQKRVGALLVGNDPLFGDRRVQLATLAVRHAVPTIYPSRAHPEAGGLMSYGSNFDDRERQAGVYVGRILKGEKPSDLPVMQPTKFELVINLKTAKAIGLEIPATLLTLADEVIE